MIAGGHQKAEMEKDNSLVDFGGQQPYKKYTERGTGQKAAVSFLPMILYFKLKDAQKKGSQARNVEEFGSVGRLKVVFS